MTQSVLQVQLWVSHKVGFLNMSLLGPRNEGVSWDTAKGDCANECLGSEHSKESHRSIRTAVAGQYLGTGWRKNFSAHSGPHRRPPR